MMTGNGIVRVLIWADDKRRGTMYENYFEITKESFHYDEDALAGYPFDGKVTGIVIFGN